MKTVLWISRHTMTEPQLRDLARVLGDTVQVLPYTQTVKQADVLRPLIEQADAIAAVLPVELLAELVTLADERRCSSRSPDAGSPAARCTWLTDRPSRKSPSSTCTGSRSSSWNSKPGGCNKKENSGFPVLRKNFFVKCEIGRKSADIEIEGKKR